MPFRPEEILSTARLDLRPPTLDDCEPIFSSYAQDPEVTRYLSWEPHESVQTTERFLQEVIAAWTERRRCVWVIRESAGQRLIGGIEARVEGHQVEVGYVFERPAWGKGYATEATRAVVEHALASPDVWRVSALCAVENRASARVLEKCGMRLEGKLRRGYRFPNLGKEPEDVLLYAIAKETCSSGP